MVGDKKHQHGAMTNRKTGSGPSFINTFASKYKTFASRFAGGGMARGKGQRLRGGKKFWAS